MGGARRSSAAVPLAWRACSGVGSEAPALACLAACAWGLSPRTTRTRGRAVWRSGSAAGSGSGVRLSWAPLYFAALVARAARVARARGRSRSPSRASPGPSRWSPSSGPSRLVALNAAHFAGHAQRWGGTVVDGAGRGPPRVARARRLRRRARVRAATRSGIAVGGAARRDRGVGLAGVETRRAGVGGRRRSSLVAPVPRLDRARPEPARPAAPRPARSSRSSPARSRSPAAASRRALARGRPRSASLVATRSALDAHARRTIPPPGAAARRARARAARTRSPRRLRRLERPLLRDDGARVACLSGRLARRRAGAPDAPRLAAVARLGHERGRGQRRVAVAARARGDALPAPAHRPPRAVPRGVRLGSSRT